MILLQKTTVMMRTSSWEHPVQIMMRMMTSKVMKIFPEGVKGKIKVIFNFFIDQTLWTYNKNT